MTIGHDLLAIGRGGILDVGIGTDQASGQSGELLMGSYHFLSRIWLKTSSSSSSPQMQAGT